MSPINCLIFVILIGLSSAVTNDILVHKNEVSVEMEAHIISYALALVANQTDINSIGTKLVTEMNSKYGASWLVYTGPNETIANIYFEAQPHTLFWFSFHGQNFYLIKPLIVNQIPQQNTTQLSNFNELIAKARTADIKTLISNNMDASLVQEINTQIRYQLNVTENCVSGQRLLYFGDTCFTQFAERIERNLTNPQWEVVVTEKSFGGAFRRAGRTYYSVLVGDLWFYFDGMCD